jgi:hypothetical protein
MKSANLLSESDRAYLSENAPLPPFFGSIIHDFEAILEYIGAKGVPVSPKTSEFAIATLPEINACLAEPGHIGFARGRQTSYPHANGLHMLLRTSRMGKIDRSGKSPRMVLDPALLERWRTLNVAERYFFLLEAWWSFLSRDGSQRNFVAANAMDYRDRLVKHLTLKGIRIQDAPRLLEPYFDLLGMSEIALLQMFGMLRIHQGQTIPGEGWQIERMAATRWGLIACRSFWAAHRAEEFLENFLASDGESAADEDEDEDAEEAGEGQDDVRLSISGRPRSMPSSQTGKRACGCRSRKRPRAEASLSRFPWAKMSGAALPCQPKLLSPTWPCLFSWPSNSMPTTFISFATRTSTGSSAVSMTIGATTSWMNSRTPWRLAAPT